jgi:predicted Zn-ribbon and HTH transcriptional regulator
MNKGIEVQDIFTAYGPEYLNRHAPPPHVQKVMRAIQNCRTSVMGGHTDVCNECGYTHISYNSCRNRHCPKCQALSKERWVMARGAELLPVPYFHVVFTLPSELDSVVFMNQETLYGLLFKASQETIRELARDKKYLGAEIGLTAILHTWGQNLTPHPHVHMIVPGGGLTADGKWKNSRKKFFIPVKVASKKFRGKFLYYLKKAELDFKGSQAYLKDAGQFDNLISSLYEKDWYVYCKRPFKTTNSVLEYLGRYTHRIAISNHRIVSCDNSQVVFRWRDYRDGSKVKLMTLSADEFIRRFLLHVLPPGFTKIRHYGFLASCVKSVKLALCQKQLFKMIPDKPEPLSTIELIQKLTGIDITVCPICGSPLCRASPGVLTA